MGRYAPPTTDPSPLEILIRAAEVRATWSETEHRRRWLIAHSVGPIVPPPTWTPPEWTGEGEGE